MLERVKERAIQSVAYQVDRLANRYFLNPPSKKSKAPSPNEPTPVERIARIEEMAAPYDQLRYFDSPETFFPTLPPANYRTAQIAEYGRNGKVLDLQWSSALEPVHPDPKVRLKLEERAETNHTAVARAYFHRDQPRPAIIMLHGYRAGNLDINRFAFPVSWFFSKLGFDVVLGVLPHHGPRGERGKLPLLPAGDPRVTIESFRHAIVDLKTLVSVLRNHGCPQVGALGMSLGGYTVSLLATVEELDFVVPMIPLASVAAMAAYRFSGSMGEVEAQVDALEKLHSVVSPFSRPSKVPAERALVIGGQVDQVTPIDHAERLAHYFRCPLHTFPGGHILQAGRKEGFLEVAAMLHRADIVAR